MIKDFIRNLSFRQAQIALQADVPLNTSTLPTYLPTYLPTSIITSLA